MLVLCPFWWLAVSLWQERRWLLQGYRDSWSFLRYGRKAAPR